VTADRIAFEDVLRRVLREELAALRRELAATRHRPADPTLALFLVAGWAFTAGRAFTAAELLDDAAFARARDLLDVLSVIHGDRGDPAKRLGRWLERHAGSAAEGLRLVQVKREAGAWLYAVTKD
jgi:hypothetical protein